MAAAAVAAKSLQSCPTLCDPIDDSPPGSSVPGILQARILERVAISFSNHACMLSHFSHVRHCATLWSAAHQAPLSTGCSRQEYWSGLPFPSPIACRHAKSHQSCPTMCDPMDSSPPGSSVHRILQARTLQLVAISFYNSRVEGLVNGRMLMDGCILNLSKSNLLLNDP